MRHKVCYIITDVYYSTFGYSVLSKAVRIFSYVCSIRGCRGPPCTRTYHLHGIQNIGLTDWNRERFVSSQLKCD